MGVPPSAVWDLGIKLDVRHLHRLSHLIGPPFFEAGLIVAQAGLERSTLVQPPE